MRLIKSDTIELHEYLESQVPPYAILSHRWEDGEVSLQNLQSGLGLETRGYEKILKCCHQAANDGWEYVWIDTCCIDKTSSAELSEAINSMYRWYQNSQVCYAYLSDVPSAMDKHSRPNSAFRNSKWFTRGWTLQELVAPTTVEFYDQNWTEIGTKSSMRNLIQEITGIQYLDDINDACVGEKLSWAAKRYTTRIEDLAYCLMGLFAINMPLLYGEGEKAFQRLQREIWTATDDDSLFAWNFPQESAHPKLGLFAHTPAWFETSSGVTRDGRISKLPKRSYQALHIHDTIVTNKEVYLDYSRNQRGFPYIDSKERPDCPRDAKFLVPLRCGPRNATEREIFAIFMIRRVQFHTWYRGGQLGIFHIEELEEMKDRDKLKLSRMRIPHLSTMSIAGLEGQSMPNILFNDESIRGTGFKIDEAALNSYPQSLQYKFLQNPKPRGVLVQIDPTVTVHGTFSLTVTVGIIDSLSTKVFLLCNYHVEDTDDSPSNTARDGCSLQAIPRTRGMTLKDAVDLQLRESALARSKDRSDRISWPVTQGKSMSAAVKRSIRAGRLNLIVTITLDDEGKLRWAVPSAFTPLRIQNTPPYPA